MTDCTGIGPTTPRVMPDGEPCPEDHCGVCGWRHLDNAHPNVCPSCVGRVRNDLARIVELYEALPDEAAHHSRDSAAGATVMDVMGGEAMTFLGPFSSGLASINLIRDDDRHPGRELWQVEEGWREWLGVPTGLRWTLWRCADFLGEHLTRMAQVGPRRYSTGEPLPWCEDLSIYGDDIEFPPEFPLDAAAIRQAKSALEAVVKANVRPVVGVRCLTPDCDGDLMQPYADPDPCDHEHAPCGCDQGGRRDTWRCGRCDRRYTDAEYRRAVALWQADHQPLRTAAEIREMVGIEPATLWQWVHRGHIKAYGSQGKRRYHIGEVRRRAQMGGLSSTG